MSLSLEELRERLSALDRPHQNTRYPMEIKSLVVEYARDRFVAGEGLKPVAKSLGLCAATLRTWLARAGRRPVSSGMDAADVDSAVFLPVRVSGDAPLDSKALVLVTPGGYRVEGLDAAGAAELLMRVP